MNPTGEPLLRYYGRCPHPGCAHRRVVEEGSHRMLHRRSFNNRYGAGCYLELSDNRQRHCNLLSPNEVHDPRLKPFLSENGFVCPEHDSPLRWQGGVFQLDPDKVCDGRCVNATGPSCSCSCGGKNHGAAFI